MRIYVASSWRNKQQPTVVASLVRAGHEVYDFRNPTAGEPELMVKMCDFICVELGEVFRVLRLITAEQEDEDNA